MESRISHMQLPPLLVSVLLALILAGSLIQGPMGWSQEPPAATTPTATTPAEVPADKVPASYKTPTKESPVAAEAPQKKPVKAEDVTSKNEIKSADEAITQAKSVKKYAQEGNWRMLIATVLFLLVFVIRKIWDAIPSKYLPWAVAGVALALSTADGLVSGESVMEIITGGIETSTMAGGIWGLLKPFLGKYLTKSTGAPDTGGA